MDTVIGLVVIVGVFDADELFELVMVGDGVVEDGLTLTSNCHNNLEGLTKEKKNRIKKIIIKTISSQANFFFFFFKKSTYILDFWDLEMTRARFVPSPCSKTT